MLKRFLHHMKIYQKLIAIQISSQVQYRASLILDVINTGINTTVEFASLALIFSRFGSIRGWSLAEVAFLYGLAEISFGIMDTVFDGYDPQRFGLQVRRGFFDQLMLRPVNLIIQVLGSGFAWRRAGKIAIGVFIFVFSLRALEISWTIPKILYIPIIIIGMVAFFGGLFIAGATITFWTIDSIEVVNILTYGSSYAISHPMHIYPDFIRRFFTFILPAALLNYYPALYILGKTDPNNPSPVMMFLSPVAGIGILVAAIMFWEYGVNKYQSTGT